MNRRYPQQPIVGVGAIIVRPEPSAGVVLVKRSHEPLRGEWTIPGGVLEIGEALREGACREAREETGLIVHPLGGVEVFDRIVRDGNGAVEFHYVLLDFVCEATGGELRAGDDVEAAQWFGEDDLRLAGVSEFTAEIVRRVLARLSA